MQQKAARIEKKVNALLKRVTEGRAKIRELEQPKNKEIIHKEYALLTKILDEAAGHYDSPSIAGLIQDCEEEIYSARERMEQAESFRQSVDAAEKELKRMGFSPE